MTSRETTSDDQHRGRSIGWVVRMSLAIVISLGWGIMAAEYAKRDEGWNPLVQPRRWQIPFLPPMLQLAASSGFANFGANAIEQLPDAPKVVEFNVRHLPWIPAGTAVAAGFVVAGGFGLKRLERQIDRPPPWEEKPGVNEPLSS
jgi:hypothetical protein